MGERHGLADFLEEELPKLESKWRSGSATALVQAFVWCAANGYTFPNWLLEATKDELLYSLANKPRGGTKLATAFGRESMERIHQVRFELVEQNLRWQHDDLAAGRRSTISEIEAARDAQAFLAAHKNPAGAATPEAIRRSWRRIKSA